MHTHTNTLKWHYRLGHLSDDILRLIHGYKNLHLPSIFSCKTCSVCPLAKQKRLPFTCHNHFSDACFDLIHCDIWGPFHTPTYGNHRFFLSIVDDHSRFTWIFLLQSKQQAFVYIKKKFQFVKTQFQKSIKCLRSDNAKEFLLTDFLASEGTLHQFSCPYTPEQNSIVERKHQHLLNVARSLLFQSNVPIVFWGDCILTATYIINRIPSLVLNNCSPYQILYNIAPDYSNFKIFGSLCYATTQKHERQKFSPRVEPTIFIGYPTGVKGYKLYGLESGKIIISRNVIFHENSMPFIMQHHHSTSKLNQTSDPFIHTVVPLQMIFLLPQTFFNHQAENSHPSHNDNNDLTYQPNIPRRSSRNIHPPAYLNEYIVSIPNLQSSNSIYHSISYDKLSTAYRNFVVQISNIYEPTYYHQVVRFPERQTAMDKELEAMDTNHT